MSFIWPTMLLFLILVPLFVLLYLRLQQRRRQVVARYGSLGLVQAAHGHEPGIRRHIPPAFFLAGLTILIVSLARPQTVVSLPRVEGTVILAFDVSGSMSADDLQPTRMEAAKTAALDFVERQPSSVQIGVVAFSESGFSVQTPTNEQEDILAAINRLSPQRGTSLGHGILISLNTIAASFGLEPLDQGSSPNNDPSSAPIPTLAAIPEGTFDSAAIILLTDGENTAPPDPFEAALAAGDLGVRIYTVGIGSASGTTINVEGFTVHTQLNEPVLQEIAQLSGGAYYHAQNEEDLRTIYENLAPQWVIKPEKMEVTPIFAGVSILVLLIGGIFSLLWFSRMP